MFKLKIFAGSAAAAAAFLAAPQQASACQSMPSVYFRNASVAIDPEGIATLQGFAQQALGRMDDVQAIRVTGHSDRTGPKAARQRISLRRALAVADMLMAYGIPARLISTFGAGDSRPFADTADNVREPLNRRADIRIAVRETPADSPPATCG